MSALFLINVMLTLAWGAVTGSFTFVNLALGFALSTAAMWLIREQFGTSNYFKRSWLIVSLAVLFLKELVLSAVRVARLVLTPSMHIRPGFIAFPLTTDRPAEITLLANMITLTPGTLSVDVSDDRKTLYVHAIDVPDKDVLVTDIAQGFERKIMETLR